MKILVVDDEHILRTRLKSVLEQSGLPLSAVFTAENALNAIECIEKEQPQIVITDIRMPIMSGLELATHIHTHYPQITRTIRRSKLSSSPATRILNTRAPPFKTTFSSTF